MHGSIAVQRFGRVLVLLVCVTRVCVLIMEHITNELAGARAYIANQRRLGVSAEQVNECRKGIADGLCLQIAQLRNLATADATRLLDAIQDSDFSDVEKQQIGRCAVGKAKESATPAPVSTSSTSKR